MRRAFLVSVTLMAFAASTAVVACNSGSGSSPDAPVSHGPLGFGSACNTVSNMSTECMSGVCTSTFNMFPTPVCSVQCTMLGSADDPECPNGSMGMKCNQQGYCRP
jgi:hypothetical protein